MKKLILWLLPCLYLFSSTAFADDRTSFVYDVAWHPDGTKIALSITYGYLCGPTTDGLELVIVSYPSLETLYTIEPQIPCVIESLEWSSDGEYLLLTTRFDAFVWQLSTQQFISTSESFYRGEDRLMDKVKPNDEIVANITYAVGLAFWNMQTGRPIADLPTMQYAYAVSWNPDGSKLVIANSVNRELVCSILETTHYQLISTFDCIDWNPVWSPDGQWILTSKQGSAYLWNATTLILERSWDHRGSDLEWSPDSQFLASSYASEKTFSIIRVSDSSKVYTQTLTDPIMTFEWSPDGNTIVYGGDMTDENPLGIGFISRSMFDSCSLITPTPSQDD